MEYKFYNEIIPTLFSLFCVCIVNANEIKYDSLTNKNITMSKIKFTPEEFSSVDVSEFGRHRNHSCTPYIREITNEIKINTPKV